VCIGCKACEVACKQWNDLPADGSQFVKGGSYDHTGDLSASTWRHVRFVELLEPSPQLREEAQRALEHGAGGNVPVIPATGGGNGDVSSGEGGTVDVAEAVRKMGEWVFMSDVCKHCTNAGCLDACPTGALIRTEYQTVVLQPDVCNGCGYCVSACPFGVVERRADDGRAWKCTLCYDRQNGGMVPACAKACPTASIQFGELSELRARAERRVEQLHARGVSDAYLYGADAASQPGTQGLHAFFLLCDDPEVYNLPPDPVVPTVNIERSWWAMAAGVLSLAALAVGSVFSVRRS
jgi:formate dehydrogenase iron-sulfur subunit